MSKLKALIVLALLVAAGCSDAEYDKHWRRMGVKHHITAYSGGKVIGEWTSTGMPESDKESDGWYFRDSTTGKFIALHCDVVVEMLDK